MHLLQACYALRTGADMEKNMKIGIAFKELVKKYGDTTIIKNISFEVKPGEFFTLLGPSGCGKTTLLRMIAGFNSIEGGSISFNDKVINQTPPGKRNIGMVFQNYAIFPHLSVKNNVAFGLKNRRVSSEEIDKKVRKILSTVKMDEYIDRMPERLSGGQQQRIALARAIVIEPDVLLMDEPLSNLDAKLRVDMRNSIKEIQNSVGITTVYVTHDQEEAMAVSDRIAVMKDGELQHVGTPRNIYHRPSNVFVATFIGHSNILKGKLTKEEGKHRLHLGAHYSERVENLEDFVPGSSEVKVRISVRPEEFMVCRPEEGIRATILNSVYLGLNTHYFVELETGERAEIIEESSVDEKVKKGEIIGLRLKAEKINIFDAEGERNYTKGVINDAAVS